jgi:NADPH-dependent curcumin reductase CurA
VINRQFLLAARPVGMPRESDFELTESPLDEPREGEILAKAVYFSVDPYMRAKIGAAKAYTDQIKVGDVMVGLAVSQVIDSRNSRFVPGDVLLAEWGWREYAVSDGKAWLKPPPQSLPISTKLGVLGVPGISAYFDCGKSASRSPEKR